MLARRPYPLIFLCFWKYRYLTPSFNRPGFQQKLEDIEAGYVTTVIVKDDCVILELNSESPENTGLCDVSSVF